MGHRADGGFEVFSPRREASIDATGLAVPGLGGGTDTGTVESGAEWFGIPSAGYVKPMGDGITLGLTFVANGGMNTRYNHTNLFTAAFAPAAGAFGTALKTPPPDWSARFLPLTTRFHAPQNTTQLPRCESHPQSGDAN